MTPAARVALHVFEWSGTEQQRVVLGWSWIEGPADLAAGGGDAARYLQRSFAQYPDGDRPRHGLRGGGARRAGRTAPRARSISRATAPTTTGRRRP